MLLFLSISVISLYVYKIVSFSKRKTKTIGQWHPLKKHEYHLTAKVSNKQEHTKTNTLTKFQDVRVIATGSFKLVSCLSGNKELLPDETAAGWRLFCPKSGKI